MEKLLCIVTVKGLSMEMHMIPEIYLRKSEEVFSYSFAITAAHF